MARLFVMLDLLLEELMLALGCLARYAEAPFSGLADLRLF